MRKPLQRLLAAASLAGLTLTGGMVFGQDAGPPGPAPELPDVEVPMQKRAEISVGEMQQQTASYLKKMREVLKHIVELQEVARKNKDVIRLNCVNDKLLQVKQLLNIADVANTNLEEALARNDEEGRYHEFGRITIAYQQVQVLNAEAETCVGEDLSFLGPTQVTVEQPEEPDDPTVEPTPDFPVIEIPPLSSPFA
jgi:hypothetical protein